MLAEAHIKEEYFPPHPGFYFNQIEDNTSSQSDSGEQLTNQYINSFDDPKYYNQQFPLFNIPDYLSPDNSEDEERTNFCLSSAENASQIIHNYPTPSTSPHFGDENGIKDQIKNDHYKCNTSNSSRKPKKLSDEVVYELDKLKRTRETLFYEVIRRHVNFNSKIELWLGKSIYYNLPPEVLTQLNEMLKQGFKYKNELIDLMNRVVPKDYAYNPNKSHIVLDYDKITLMVIRLLNNVASRRSRYRKKFANHIKLHCLKIDMDENILLHKKQCYLQNIVRELENKMLDLAINHNAIFTLRGKCGLI
ncbi:unnamed protein product [Diamesa tonsa]